MDDYQHTGSCMQNVLDQRLKEPQYTELRDKIVCCMQFSIVVCDCS